MRVTLSAVSPSHPSWAQPIDVYFRRIATGWKLIGLERMPNQSVSATDAGGDRGQR
jgi:hypothetical protein